MSTLYVQTPTLYLSGAGVIVGATSISLTDLVDIYGNVLTMTDFGSVGYITLEPDTTNAEGATFTGITANANGTYTLTGVKTILAKNPYTETSGLVRNHAGGTKVVVTDNVGFWNTFGNKNNANTWAATQTFTVTPVSANQPTLSTEVANKEYVDGVAIAGAANAATDVKGIAYLSVAAASTTGPIVVGDNDPRVSPVSLASLTSGRVAALAGDTDLPSATNLFVTQQQHIVNTEKYAEDAGSTDAYAISLPTAPNAYATGMIIVFKANTANTGTATLNVNSLGAKTIVKDVSTTLANGDIATSQLCVCVYNGTNFLLQNSSAPKASNGYINLSASATTTITLGFRPKKITIDAATGGSSGGNGPATSRGGYDVTTNTQWCIYTTFYGSGSVWGSGYSTSLAVVIGYSAAGAPTNTTATVLNITDTGFDIGCVLGTSASVAMWTAIG